MNENIGNPFNLAFELVLLEIAQRGARLLRPAVFQPACTVVLVFAVAASCFHSSTCPLLQFFFSAVLGVATVQPCFRSVTLFIDGTGDVGCCIRVPNDTTSESIAENQKCFTLACNLALHAILFLFFSALLLYFYI